MYAVKSMTPINSAETTPNGPPTRTGNVNKRKCRYFEVFILSHKISDSRAFTYAENLIAIVGKNKDVITNYILVKHFIYYLNLKSLIKRAKLFVQGNRQKASRVQMWRILNSCFKSFFCAKCNEIQQLDIL